MLVYQKLLLLSACSYRFLSRACLYLPLFVDKPHEQHYYHTASSDLQAHAAATRCLPTIDSSSVAVLSRQAPLAGFRDTDCYQLVYPDRLHQDGKGVGLRLITWTYSWLIEADHAHTVHERLTCTRTFRDNKLCSGVFEGQSTAAESAFLLKCLPAALVGINTALVKLIASEFFLTGLCCAITV